MEELEELKAIVSDAEFYGMDAVITGDCVQVTHKIYSDSGFICQATNSWDYEQWKQWVLSL